MAGTVRPICSAADISVRMVLAGYGNESTFDAIDVRQRARAREAKPRVAAAVVAARWPVRYILFRTP